MTHSFKRLAILASLCLSPIFVSHARAQASAPFFDDVPASAPYYNHVNLMYLRFITFGCSANPMLFCPDYNIVQGPPLSRGAAAVFIIRSIYSAVNGNPEGFNYPTSAYFGDVPNTHPWFRYIQKMKDLGITSGCDATHYCPDDALTFGQIAVFGVRARLARDNGGNPGWADLTECYNWPYFTCGNSWFGDVSQSHPYFRWIQKAYDYIGSEAAAPGCASGSFLSGRSR